MIYCMAHFKNEENIKKLNSIILIANEHPFLEVRHTPMDLLSTFCALAYRQH